MGSFQLKTYFSRWKFWGDLVKDKAACNSLEFPTNCPRTSWVFNHCTNVISQAESTWLATSRVVQYAVSNIQFSIYRAESHIDGRPINQDHVFQNEGHPKLKVFLIIDCDIMKTSKLKAKPRDVHQTQTLRDIVEHGFT